MTEPHDDVMVRRRGGRPSRRDEVVRAAAEAFAANGYHNTSLNDIAEHLSMTAAGILHHFGSKDNLLTAVLALRDEDSLTFYHGVSPADLIDHMVETAERNEQLPGLTQLYAVLSAESVTADHPAQEWFRERYSALRVSVDEALRGRAELSEGELVQESEWAARSLISAMDGLQVQWLLDNSVTMTEPLQWLADSLVEQLRAAAARASR